MPCPKVKSIGKLLECGKRNDLPGLVGDVFPLPSSFRHCPGGHVHHPSSSGHVFRCHWHAKIHVIHFGAFGDYVVWGSAEHGLSHHALHERLDPVVERFWVTTSSAVRVVMPIFGNDQI